MITITPSLWFDHSARAAVDFYLSVLPESTELGATSYPTDHLPAFQQEFAGQELEIRFRVGNLQLSAINAGPQFQFNPAISLQLVFNTATDPDAANQLDEVWAQLAAGGAVLMALDEYDFAPRYGWLADRFGVNWQLMLNAADEPLPLVTPQLLFTRAALATEAISYYTKLFPDSRFSQAYAYPPAAGQPDGALMYSEFWLAGTRFTAMDSVGEHDFAFNEAVSLIVTCADQAEIDHYWGALSAVPEAEQCGWCKDRFGVSWQIVGDQLDEALTKPGAWEKMLSMKKLVLADFD